MIRDIDKDVLGQTEEALQQKCYFWFHNTFPRLRGLLFSVPNGGKRDAKTMMDLKATGLVNGVSDLIFLYHSKAFLIELKKDEKAKQSKHQKRWQAQVESSGFQYFVIRSLSDFKKLINTIVDY